MLNHEGAQLTTYSRNGDWMVERWELANGEIHFVISRHGDAVKWSGDQSEVFDWWHSMTGEVIKV